MTYEENCDPPESETDSWSGWALDDAEINGICERRLDGDRSAVEDLRLKMRDETREILGRNWRVVEKLAATLRENAVVSGDVLVQILSEVH